MTREQVRTLLPVMQAWSEGKTIQFKTAINADWIDWNNDLSPGYDQDWQWRVKPAAREFWLVAPKNCPSMPYAVWSSLPASSEILQSHEIVHVREVL